MSPKPKKIGDKVVCKSGTRVLDTRVCEYPEGEIRPFSLAIIRKREYNDGDRVLTIEIPLDELRSFAKMPLQYSQYGHMAHRLSVGYPITGGSNAKIR